MARKTALIVGATGAVGRRLAPLVAASHDYARLIVLHRRPTPFAKLAKVEEHVIDFAELMAFSSGGEVHAVFCCVGTTQKKAGSTAAFEQVDRDIPVALARWAAAKHASVFVTLSSLGADAGSSSVYLRTKGEMEAGVAGSGVRSAYILRPSLLKGERSEFRLAERVGNRALSIVGPLMVGPMRRYRAVGTDTVARAMLACAQKGDPGVHIVESDAIQDLGAP
jgi:uncharacterized protein YbjT (DUF2867 family)